MRRSTRIGFRMQSYNVSSLCSLSKSSFSLLLTEVRCLCGAQFCYLCGARWKTCECKYFDDDQRVNYGDADYDEIPEDDPMADEDDDPMTQGEDDLIAHEEGDPVAQTDDGPMAQQRNSLSLLLVWAIRFLALVDFGLIVLAIFGYIDRHQARRQLVLPRVLTKLWLIVLDIFRYIERLLDRTDLVVNKVLANLAEN